MPPPSQLSIAISSLLRLVKEEASYHKEMVQQEQRLQKLEQSTDADEEEGNREYEIKQQKQALQETKAIFPPLRQRISESTEKLEIILRSDEGLPEEEVVKAKDALIQAKSL
ncbi:MAG: hypothetical protein M1829_003574 [Trizodia sp. TS-e1964]|nr:MAG: hypothetical protein M1829_003574 [Trizodia sp. TS-e1964]